MNIENKTAAFTGHRTEKLPENLNKLKENIEIEVLSAVKQGYSTFYTGMAYGFDLIAGAVVLEMKKETDLQLIAAVPFHGQEKNFSNDDKEEYGRILGLCDEVVYCYEVFHRGVYHQRNRLMVDNSSLVIAYCDGTGGTQYTVNYAQKKGLLVKNLFPISE